MERAPIAFALTMAAGALTVAPVVAVAILLWSSVASDNISARLPPREGQALYSLSGNARVDESLIDLAKGAAGADGTTTEFWTVAGRDDASVVARQDGTGGIDAVTDAQSLEQLIGTRISGATREALESGGIVWGPGFNGRDVWNTESNPATKVVLPSSATFKFNDRWARDTAGFMLVSSAREAGFNLSNHQVAIDGLSNAEESSLTATLQGRGYDARVVSTFRGGDAYAITPFQAGLVFLIGIVGLSIAVASLRANVRALRRQSSSVAAIGAPRLWLARVFLEESGSAYVLGAILGGISAYVILIIGLTRLSVPLDIPFGALGFYVGLLAILLVLIVAEGMRNLATAVRTAL